MAVASDVVDVQGCEDEQGDPDEDWPERDEKVGQGGVDDGRVASYILEDIEPVSLNDNGCKPHNVSTTRGDAFEEQGARTKNHVQDRKAQPNKKIDHKRTAFLFYVTDHKAGRDVSIKSRSAKPNEGCPVKTTLT